jgi:hypothetical protein
MNQCPNCWDTWQNHILLVEEAQTILSHTRSCSTWCYLLLCLEMLCFQDTPCRQSHHYPQYSCRSPAHISSTGWLQQVTQLGCQCRLCMPTPARTRPLRGRLPPAPARRARRALPRPEEAARPPAASVFQDTRRILDTHLRIMRLLLLILYLS